LFLSVNAAQEKEKKRRKCCCPLVFQSLQPLQYCAICMRGRGGGVGGGGGGSRGPLSKLAKHLTGNGKAL
jgi:hypothetical protein